MNIDVKQNDSGYWFSSFAIEIGSRPADVLSVVTDESATTSNISIPKSPEKINPKSKDNSKKVNFSLSNSSDKVVISRGEREKQRAQYQSDRVYNKNEIEEADADGSVFF